MEFAPKHTSSPGHFQERFVLSAYNARVYLPDILFHSEETLFLKLQIIEEVTVQ